jgi:tetratricopeptide (TPR) repeat protein
VPNERAKRHGVRRLAAAFEGGSKLPQSKARLRRAPQEYAVKAAILVSLLVLSPAALWQRVWRETNSHAAAQRGTTQYSRQKYDESARSFARADKLAPSAKSAFNLGTSQIAAGRTTDGSATLARAMTDPSLRADSLYNRGNSALASKAFEYAIRDYVEVLKLRPHDAQAKRNLEIALDRLQETKQQSGGKQGQQQPSPSQQQQSQKAPSAGQKQQQQQQGDAEALLRSVQQQEQEELQRMKRARGETTRVGW